MDTQARILQVRQEAEQRQRQKDARIAELVAALQTARGDVGAALLKFQEAATALQTQLRRDRDIDAGAYFMYASAHVRLAGALQTGIKRTVATDRLLKKAKEDREETLRRAEKEKRREQVVAHGKLVQSLAQPSPDAFDDLYSEVVNASDDI